MTRSLIKREKIQHHSKLVCHRGSSSRVMMLILLTMMMMVNTVMSSYSGCVNSCCQACSSPDHCDACYTVNTNPQMCPCVGDEKIFVDSSKRNFERLISSAEYEKKDEEDNIFPEEKRANEIKINFGERRVGVELSSLFSPRLGKIIQLCTRKI